MIVYKMWHDYTIQFINKLIHVHVMLKSMSLYVHEQGSKTCWHFGGMVAQFSKGNTMTKCWGSGLNPNTPSPSNAYAQHVYTCTCTWTKLCLTKMHICTCTVHTSCCDIIESITFISVCWHQNIRRTKNKKVSTVFSLKQIKHFLCTCIYIPKNSWEGSHFPAPPTSIPDETQQRCTV